MSRGVPTHLVRSGGVEGSDPVAAEQPYRIIPIKVAWERNNVGAEGTAARRPEKSKPKSPTPPSSDVSLRALGAGSFRQVCRMAMAVVAVVGLAALTAVGAHGIEAVTASLLSTTSTPSNLLEGVYVGAADPAGVAAFGLVTDTSPTIASDYLPSDGGWSGMDGAGGSLSWLTGPWQGSGYTLSLGVPMIPTDSFGTAMGTLAAGATGAYNSYFVTLAQTLVAAGEGNAYLRLGWEFDGGWYAWSATSAGAEASYAAYFDQIVTAMRSVSGQSFKFVWNPDAQAFNEAPYDVTLAYPGNSYVDVIGLDDYDQTWVTPQTPANEWSETSLPGLEAAHSFAAAQGKPLAITEWGLTIRSDGHGLGDDPLYINDFTSWMKDPSNDVLFESYFNFDPTGDNSQITDGLFPSSLLAFIADLGASSTTGTTSPAPTTTSTSLPPPSTTTSSTAPPTTTSTSPPTPPTTTSTPSGVGGSSTTTTSPSTTTTTSPPLAPTTTSPGVSSPPPLPVFPETFDGQVCQAVDYRYFESTESGDLVSMLAAQRVEELLHNATAPMSYEAFPLQIAINSQNGAYMVGVFLYLEEVACPPIAIQPGS
jgi:hypothetical protein